MDDTAVIFHRSGFRGSQKYANLFWAGDQTTTWDEYDGFRSSIIGLLNGGLSGMVDKPATLVAIQTSYHQ